MKKTITFFIALSLLCIALSGVCATYTPGVYTGTAQGHNGVVSVEVTLSADAIDDITVTQSNETGGIGDVAAAHVIQDVLSNQSLNVDAVGGCTISAAAFRRAIEDALTQSGADLSALRSVPKAEQITEPVVVEADVCVVGSGAAGLMAAYEAANQGASVVVLEKLPRNGGATRISSAMIVAGGTDLQAQAGIEDSVQNLKDYWRERGEGNVDTQMTDYVAEHINENLDLFLELGVNYSSSLILQSGTATINRAHMPAQSGVEFCDRLVEKLTQMGVVFHMETKAESLIQNDAGEIIGVNATHQGGTVTVHADAVVLATGGYSWNSDMIAAYSPDAIGAWPVTAPGSTGDGLAMAMDVGADTVFKGGFIGWKVVSPAYGHTTAIGAPIYGAANLIVNATGSRFTDESVDYPFLYNAMQQDGSDHFYFIFQSGAADTTDLVNNVSSTIPNLELGVEAGVCFKADTIEELAEKAVLPQLADAVAQYNAAISTGVDDDFGRNVSTMTAIEEGPFYALQCQRAILGTFGGLNTHITGEVVTADGAAIPGLYAAGEVANGAFFPKDYPASGSSLSMCVVLGREAGASAADYAVAK